MKKILVAIALVLGAATACTSTPKYVDMRVEAIEPTGQAGSGVVTSSKPFIGPTLEEMQPLTPDERFILAYRSIRPGDVRTDAQVLALANGCP